MRIVFMGTPDFAVPSLRAIANHTPEFELVGVFSQPDRPVGRGLELSEPPVKKLAKELGVPVYQPEKRVNIEDLKALQPDLIVVVAFGQILKNEVLELPRFGCINVHSSLLPRWRGAAPIHWALLSGDPQTGVTIMKLVEKLDAGDILMSRALPISKTVTCGELHDRLAEMGAELLIETLRGLRDQKITPQVQDEAQVTYAKKLTKEMEALDVLGLTAIQVDLRVRALNPWPGTSVWVQTGPEVFSRLKVKAGMPHPGLNISPANRGKIFEQNGMVLLGTSEGAYEVKKMQWDGKKEFSPGEFLNGLKGQKLNLPLALKQL